MSLDKIIAQLKLNKLAMPPVHLWDPPYCGEMDIEIKADGSWYYENSIFKRLSLVKLLASVLVKQEAEYFLVTPVEKIKIRVADLPFVITQWRWLEECIVPTMLVTTNLGDEIILDSEHPLSINGNKSLYLLVRGNLQAKIHRNVFYQWIEEAEEVSDANGTTLQLPSAGQKFILGTC